MAISSIPQEMIYRSDFVAVQFIRGNEILYYITKNRHGSLGIFGHEDVMSILVHCDYPLVMGINLLSRDDYTRILRAIEVNDTREFRWAEQEPRYRRSIPDIDIDFHSLNSSHSSSFMHEYLGKWGDEMSSGVPKMYFGTAREPEPPKLTPEEVYKDLFTGE